MKITKYIELGLVSKEKYRTRDGVIRSINSRKLTRTHTLNLTQTGKDEIKSHTDAFCERFASR